MKKIVISTLLLSGLLFLNGCTNLNENVLDEASAAGLTDRQAADGNLAPVYARLPDLFTHTNYFAMQEISTDEAILPYRGGTDWGDNGIYTALHQHTPTSTDPNIRNTWLILAQGISRSITAINTLPTINDSNVKTYVAEARGMRAYYNMMLLDLFGLVFAKDDPQGVSQILRGTAAFDYVKNEFLAVEPDLVTNVGPGRLTKGALWGLLARLYLNAPVYREPYAAQFTFKTEDLDKVIEYSDKVISSGQYQLSPDYFSIFNSDNHTNKELVFAVDQRAELNGHNRLAYFSISGDQFPLIAFPAANGTDGPAITPDFYQTWATAYAPKDPAGTDPRFYKQNWTIPADSCVSDFNMDRGILRGQQYGLLRVNGAYVRCGSNYRVGKLFYVTRNRPTLPVNFTEKVDFSVAGSNYNTGYRVLKYEFSKKSSSGRNLGDADISIVRLADVYLMRAEAKLRKGDAASALTDVNLIRAARTSATPAPALTSMNLDLLLRERGFELYWEMIRRTDLIRFGKYEGTWTEKTNSDRLKRLLPIPQTAVDGASNLPGYLKQNDSY
ncbi:RagB/SusD family nutrient uptake outer membrane protein [Spirosoma rigui]|uniref:RagB/SusD family nutrient uptake outer membrane protein n=1 Tax=Spirosoma rigui TaxID=564064 RepID=UPI0009B102C2|nr:RagB/SusD family nutrient uptake outer membrane protein [Spirosoma rigui]